MMSSQIRIFASSLMLWLGFAAVGQAASFDCGRATSSAELAICSDEKLGALDMLLDQAYKLAIGSANMNSQSDWLAKRDACPDRLCLHKEIGSRIAELLHLAASPQNSLNGVEVEVIQLEEDGIFLSCRENFQGTDDIIYAELLFSREEDGPTFQETNILPDNRYSESIWGWYEWSATGNAGGMNFEPKPNETLLRRNYDVSGTYVKALENGAYFAWTKYQFENDTIYFVTVNFSGDVVSKCISALNH